MAKVEQFPEETGKKGRTEDNGLITEQKAEEASGSFFDLEEPQSDALFFDVGWMDDPPGDGREKAEKEPEPAIEPEGAIKPERAWEAETAIKPESAREPETAIKPDDVINPGATGETVVFEGVKVSDLPDDSLLMGTESGRGGSEGPGHEDESPRRENGKGRPRTKDTAEAQNGTAIPDSGEALSVAKAVSRAYEEQIRQHRERVRYIRILCAATVFVVVALVALFFSSRHYNRAEILKVRDFVAEEGAVCVNFNGSILQYGPNGATCAGTGGRVRWSITYEMDQPIISVSGKTAAIADYGGRTIYLMDTKKQLCTITTSLPIHKISASESGKVAAVLDDKNATWIRLYSENGKEIAYFTRTMEENGYPMDVAVSPDGKKVCISSLKLQDSSVISNLSFYDFGKAGQKYDDHLVGNFEYEKEVFPYVRFMGNGACCAASDSRLVVIDTSATEPKNSFNNMLTESLQGIFKSGDRIALVFMDLTRENLYRLDLYGRSGKKEGSIGFSMPYKDIQIKGNRIYINNEQSMQIYTLRGNEIFDGGFDRAVKVIIPRWFGRLTAVSANEIDEVKLR